MDSPFSLTTASTSTLIIHIPDPNTTDEKEIRISAEPDSTAHNPETNDTPTNPTRNHLNLSIAPPPPPSSLPNPFNNEHWDGGMKDRGERRVEGHGGPEVAQEGSRDEADNSRVDVEPLRPVGSLEGNTTSADDSTAPTAMDESATSTTTEDHSTTLPRFEGEDEEGYTPVHRLMWKLHDEYEVRVIRPVKPLAEGEDEEVDVVGLDGEAGDEEGVRGFAEI